MKFRLSVVREKFKNIYVHNSDYNSNTVDVDHVIATVAASLVKKLQHLQVHHPQKPLILI